MYECRKYEHFQNECRTIRSVQRNQEAAKIAQEEESEDHLLLMVASNTEEVKTNTWYLDSGCSNHMTGTKNPFADMNLSSQKSNSSTIILSLQKEEVTS